MQTNVFQLEVNNLHSHIACMPLLHFVLVTNEFDTLIIFAVLINEALHLFGMVGGLNRKVSLKSCTETNRKDSDYVVVDDQVDFVFRVVQRDELVQKFF